ncbi:MAG: hypothetical protein LC104_10165 [Bacteroidales bacterium]|nr:hypothetical protein [Bacteroidales bacterium]
MMRFFLPITLLAVASLSLSLAQSPPTEGKDAELVKRTLDARQEYQDSLIAMWTHYTKAGDRERAKWVEEELKAFHLINKPSYRLDIQDVPGPNLEAKVNVKEANDLFKEAMLYKGRGIPGTEDYTLNQRRTELLLRKILQKYPNSDKIADVAYELGDLYEGRAYRQYGRAAAFYERSYQWQKGSRTDAVMRAARLYDRQLNEKGKAIELYRLEVETDTDAARLKEADRRLAELTGGSKR